MNLNSVTQPLEGDDALSTPWHFTSKAHLFLIRNPQGSFKEYNVLIILKEFI